MAGLAIVRPDIVRLHNMRTCDVGLKFNQLVHERDCDGVRFVRGVEFMTRAFKMGFCSSLGYRQQNSDFGIRLAAGDPCCDFGFAWRELDI